MRFVGDNARRVLGVDAARVLPVSARAALRAKLGAASRGACPICWPGCSKPCKCQLCSAGRGRMPALAGIGHALYLLQGRVSLLASRCWRALPKGKDDSAGCAGAEGRAEEAALAGSEGWAGSGFEELERFMLDFLQRGGESLRLKLQTPLSVADALLDAAARQLAAELATAQQARAAHTLWKNLLSHSPCNPRPPCSSKLPTPFRFHICWGSCSQCSAASDMAGAHRCLVRCMRMSSPGLLGEEIAEGFLPCPH